MHKFLVCSKFSKFLAPKNKFCDFFAKSIANALPTPELAPVITIFLNFEIMAKPLNFITFEGIEGCGKSTQAKKLYEYFLTNQTNSILTREPGGTKAGEKIRTILMDEEIDKLEAKTELLLNYASRIEHIEKIIKPAIDQGKIVICDRFFDSSFAYQGGAMELGFDYVSQLNKLVLNDFAPDITFFIDISLQEGLKRTAKRTENNRYDKLGEQFHQKIYDSYFKLAKNNSRIKIIDGMKNSDEVFQQILTIINQNI